jgi:hypothetical protein
MACIRLYCTTDVAHNANSGEIQTLLVQSVNNMLYQRLFIQIVCFGVFLIFAGVVVDAAVSSKGEPILTRIHTIRHGDFKVLKDESNIVQHHRRIPKGMKMMVGVALS